MTSTELKEKVCNRVSSFEYELDTNHFLKQEVIQGIIQCLVNQEEIMRKLNDLESKINKI